VITSTPSAETSPAASREKIKVALISIGAALFLIAAKTIVGLWTGSLALLAEAAHSGLDLFATVITALSVKAADRPADKTHHYGHGKIESLSALFEATLLFGACIWILHEAITRLQHPSDIPIVNVYSFAVIAIAIVVDYYRYKKLMQAARKYHSQALEADAIHFYSDILSSSLVLLGLIAVALGYPIADAIAALMVALWVGWLSVRLARKNLDILIDRVPEGYIEKIHDLTLGMDKILSIDKLRLRRSGPALFADMRVGIDQSLTFIEAHRKARELERILVAEVPGLDVVVHMNPSTRDPDSLDLGLMHFINSMGMQTHHLVLRKSDDRYIADLHLEVAGEMALKEAHDQATELELKILKRFPEIGSVQIHLEEISHINVHGSLPDSERLNIEARIKMICEAKIGKDRCHAITLTSYAEYLTASLHCLFPPHLSVSDVHKRTTALENELRQSISELDSVLIHAEPHNVDL
jgi:cation diffusion facilitator family transporter